MRQEEQNMSAEDNQKANSKAASFRAILDFVMGTVYVVLAGVILYSRHFGTIELPPATVYGMSGLLIVYGIFRLYLGFKRYKQER